MDLKCKIDRFVALESTSVDILDSSISENNLTVTSHTVNYVDLIIFDENDKLIQSDKGVPIGSWLKLNLVYKEHSHR